MKTRTLLLLSLLAGIGIPVGSLPVQAAQVVANYAEAEPKAGKDGYIVFVHSGGWDKFSIELCNKLIKSPAIATAAGEAVMFTAPFHQNANEKQSAEQNTAWGSLSLPHGFSDETYPCLLMYDKDGRLYARVQGPLVLRGTEADIAAAVKTRLDALHKQQEIMARANAASGVEQAKLIGEACAVPGIEWPKDALKRVKAADGSDASGMVRRLSFNPWGYAEETREMPLSQGIAEMERRLADNAYTNEQKQVFCSIAIGLLHRQGTYDDWCTKIRSYAARMKELAPETPLGRSADIVVSRWGGAMSYFSGWCSYSIPPDGRPVEIMGKLPFQSPGNYQIAFMYEGGRHSLQIKSVELRDGDRKISADAHEGVAGRNPKDHIYTVQLKGKPKNLKLFVTLGNGAEERDTRGRIFIYNK